MVQVGHRARWRVRAAAAAAALLVALTGVGAVASNGPVSDASDGEGITLTVAPDVSAALSEAEAAFLEQEAQERGITLEEVMAERDLNQRFGELATELEFRFRENYVQAEWRRDQAPQAVLVLRGPLPAELTELVEASPIDVEIVLSDGPSVDEATQALRSAMEALAERAGAGDASGSFDPLTGAMTIEYSGSKLSSEAETALRADLPSDQQVSYEHVGTEPIAEDH